MRLRGLQPAFMSIYCMVIALLSDTQGAEDMGTTISTTIAQKSAYAVPSIHHEDTDDTMSDSSIQPEPLCLDQCFNYLYYCLRSMDLLERPRYVTDEDYSHTLPGLNDQNNIHQARMNDHNFKMQQQIFCHNLGQYK